MHKRATTQNVFFDVWIAPMRRWVPQKFRGTLFEIADRTFLLFRTGTLAKTLFRDNKTIAHWEKQGNIPLPLFKVSERKVDRWYSQYQVEMIQDHLRNILGDNPTRHRGPRTNHAQFFEAVKRDFYKEAIKDE